MRYVVGADMGHAALQEMVGILRGGGAGAGAEGAAGLLRGAVFYINMALWGPRRVPTLKVSFLAVLPAFLKVSVYFPPFSSYHEIALHGHIPPQALEGNQQVVTYEVVVSMQSVVSRVPLELCEPAWDVLLNILRAIVQQDSMPSFCKITLSYELSVCYIFSDVFRKLRASKRVDPQPVTRADHVHRATARRGPVLRRRGRATRPRRLLRTRSPCKCCALQTKTFTVPIVIHTLPLCTYAHNKCLRTARRL